MNEGRKENGQGYDGRMNWNALRMRRREGDKDKKGINERKKKVFDGLHIINDGDDDDNDNNGDDDDDDDDIY